MLKSSSARAASRPSPMVSIRQAAVIVGLSYLKMKEFVLLRGIDYYQFSGRNGAIRISRRTLEAMKGPRAQKGDSDVDETT